MNSSYDEVSTALSYVSSDCNRDEWFGHLCAIHDALGQDGYQIALNWSKQSPKFNQKDFDAAWFSIKPGAITKATLFEKAYQNGMPRPDKSDFSTSQDDPPAFDGPPLDAYDNDPCLLERTENDFSESLSPNPNQSIPTGQSVQNSTSDDAEKQASVSRQWNALKLYDPLNPHEYLVKKQLTGKLNGYENILRVGYSKTKVTSGKILGNFFAYPLIDLETGQIVGFNRISSSGKMLGKDSRKAGNAAMLGILDESNAVICITEGFADGLHIHDAIRHTTLIANDVGNIANVAKRIHKLYPKSKIVVCADNDTAGIEGAEKAVKAVGNLNIIVARPVNKDFSDDVVAGLNIADSIQKAIQSSNATESTKKESDLDNAVTIFDSEYYLGFHMEDNGLIYTTTRIEKEADSKKKIEVKVDIQITFNRFEIVAKTHDSHHESWSKLISFKCDSGQIKQVIIPLSMTSGTGDEYRKLILDRGLRVSNDKFARDLLSKYLLTTEPSKIMHCLNKTGWYNGVYVLPNEVIGTTKEEILLQISSSIKDAYESKGTLEQWQENVAKYCIGNSRLTFAVSYAFASMLLEFSDADSGGIHFIGQSSIGKSTLAFVAGSIFGGRQYVNQWRNTSNALESVAASRNDGLMILDEMGQVDAKEAGTIAYMLANGSGKGRMDKSANLKPTQKWRLLFLSTGEVGLADHIKSSGKQTMAGQESRLIDLPGDTGLYGIFENLHECKDGSELSRHLRSNTRKFYGTAQRAFLTRLLQTYDTDSLINIVNDLSNQFIDDYVPADSDGQVKRVAQRFALAVIGGEIATTLGITGWSTSDAEKAANTCFNDWLKNRGGTGSIEERNALRQVRYFFEQFAFSRFKDIKTAGTDDEKTVQNLAGFRETTGTGDDEKTCFYVFPGVFVEEICKGLNPKLVIKICIEYGLLEVAGDGKSSKPKRLPAMGVKKVYHFTNKVLSD